MSKRDQYPLWYLLMIQFVTYATAFIPVALCIALLIQIEANARYNQFLREVQRYCYFENLTAEQCLSHAKTLYLLKNEN